MMLRILGVLWSVVVFLVVTLRLKIFVIVLMCVSMKGREHPCGVQAHDAHKRKDDESIEVTHLWVDI